MDYVYAQPLVLAQEDFKEEIFWIALCDSLDIPYDATSISIDIARVIILEPH